MLTLGEQIKQARKARDMTQAELAKLIGVKCQTINKYEKNVIKEIPADRLLQMELVLFWRFEKELFITFRQSDYEPKVWEIIKRLHELKKQEELENGKR